MSGYDTRLRIREFQYAVRCGDHTSDPAAAGKVDERVEAMEQQIANVQDVGFFRPLIDQILPIWRTIKYKAIYLNV